ncbi:laminin subunit beta-2-like [Pecten maximus]|uniref:laminin subunit beta-2-like n=1 Tax=Pecten maximus TaxID=6579 RepID=UPI001459109C|nr:laminin subunit beta-2-like [Pecten maximus]
MERNIFGLLLLISILNGIDCQRRQPQCEQGSCYPATGDLLIGRSSEEQLYASSTCGSRNPETYCIVSHLEEEEKCFSCDSRTPWSLQNNQSHKIENVVSSFIRDRKVRWWQAENGHQNVYIQLDLEAEFHFTHLIMTFKSFRPKAMLVERSHDFGKTWKVYRYFAYNCEKSFPGVSRGPVQNLTDVICETRYSDVEPSTGGEVIFRVLPPFIPVRDPYSVNVQNLLKLTNLRVNFTELHTLGDTLLDNRHEIKEKYYYAIYDMTVRGSCSCYGHASNCVPVPGYNNHSGMVHGQCECTHNTMGRNCELCKTGYKDVPWQPARHNQPFECQKCKCNNHADDCKFDPAVYVPSGKISGGVCIDCRHNTMGKNCQECQTFYYQDPNKDIRDPDICQPCDCDPDGSQYGGNCDSHTDPAYGLEAGRCTCKLYVTGKRCDVCKDGHFNLTSNNEYGCDTCICNTLGTIGNYGCDKDSGQCFCKRYVTGVKCDTCYPGFWNLSGEVTGCSPCDCDLGGAESEVCDSQDGQCICRPNIGGRQCNKPATGYYFTLLDYFRYEAEDARGIGRTRLYTLPSYNYSILPWRQQWTGQGFMRVSEGDSIEFTVNNIDFPMDYDIVIRYNPAMQDVWEDVRVYVVRPGPVNEFGPCANHMPSDDEKVTNLMTNRSYTVVSPPACLEPGKEYTIRLEFRRFKTNAETPDAALNIDSIVLIPNMNTVPIFYGPGYPSFLKEEFQRYGCYNSQLKAFQEEPRDLCYNLTFSISSVLHNGALECNCDSTGSEDLECNPAGGQCRCKPNVVGRRCDRCAPGTYNFGPDGCKPCNCVGEGSQDNYCDKQSGQCLCRRNIGGRICDRCVEGYYGYPSCRPCQCNGNADSCTNDIGACLQCRDNTVGNNCESCAPGYHGDPRISYRIPCEPCLCPGGPDSPIQHADSCSVDPYSRNLQCNCRPGYQAPRCDRCAENYFGHPSLLNGTCEPCICNNNIDPDVPGGCNTTTGQCLLCLFNTEGFNCERCKPGYYGDATTQSCKECVCDIYGTDRDSGACDRETGQCPCLPNVEGMSCDRCAIGFWNITSGEGCSSCGCDTEGSLGPECNQFDGQCLCKEGRGGLDCSECPANYWGDPTRECYPCDCDGQGSSQSQCDRRTGQCVCLTGITGYKCDRCARGTTGVLPNCKPCGDCFDNWDRIIRDLSAQTSRLLDDATRIKTTGAERAFDKEFRQMEQNMDEIRHIVNNASVASTDMKDLEDILKQLRQNLTQSMERLDNTELGLDNRMNNIRQGNNNIRALQSRVNDLKLKADQLVKNASAIRAKDVEGAFNITKEAQQRSQMAQAKIDNTESIMVESERIRQETEELLENGQERFDNQLAENRNNLASLDASVSGLSNRIADINEMVCDGRGDPCDDICGGGGCDKCGGVGCDNGAVTKAEDAIKLAKDAESLLAMKEDDANDLLSSINTVQRGAEDAKNEATMAYNAALRAKNETEMARLMLETLLNQVANFLSPSTGTPEHIRDIAEEVLAMSISLNPEQIMNLADEINKTIQGLQNIDVILNATSDDLNLAQKLKNQAEMAEADANSILGKAEGVLNNLQSATSAQEAADRAINQADSDISNAERDLTQIESETAAAAEKSNKSLQVLEELRIRLLTLGNKYIGNDRKVIRAEEAARDASTLATTAEMKADELATKYSDTANELNTKYNLTSVAQQRAQELKEKADRLAGDTTSKLSKLREMNSNFNTNKKRLEKLSTDIDVLNIRMDEYLQAIRDKSDSYFKCKT